MSHCRREKSQMLKLTVAVLAVVLAASASAAGWKSLTLDGSSEASFTKSVAALQDKLSSARRLVFDAALQDIWILGQQDADDAQREYTASEYFHKLDGLGYDEVVTLTGPTGETAEQRYMAAALQYSARNTRGSLHAPAPGYTEGPTPTFGQYFSVTGGAPGAGWDPSK
jgi:hypothetical protein